MSRLMVFAAPLTALLPLCIPQSVQAQQVFGNPPARLAYHAQARPIYYAAPPQGQGNSAYGQFRGRGQYPDLGASMYPSPQPNIPVQTGMTAITNQAFAPHEMLYAHKYKALYPPFYHRVKGHWIWTPFGMRSYDSWHLEGTKVTVKYHSKYKLFSSFSTPFRR